MTAQQYSPYQEIATAALSRFEAPETDAPPPWWVNSWTRLAGQVENRAKFLQEIAAKALREGLTALELMANVPATVAMEIFDVAEAIAT